MANQRTLSAIANEIRQDWKNPYFGSVPYIQVLAYLDKPSDNYGMDNGKFIINCFLANAATWRGETAKRVKLELKALAK